MKGGADTESGREKKESVPKDENGWTDFGKTGRKETVFAWRGSMEQGINGRPQDSGALYHWLAARTTDFFANAKMLP